ncbi:hypothetical protein ABZP36_023369 [Zizania latifolia]
MAPSFSLSPPASVLPHGSFFLTAPPAHVLPHCPSSAGSLSNCRRIVGPVSEANTAAVGDCFDCALHVHPLISNWSKSKVIKRANLEGIKKFGAEKEEISEGSNDGMNNDYLNTPECNENPGHEYKEVDHLKDDEKFDVCHGAGGTRQAVVEKAVQSRRRWWLGSWQP